MLTTAKPRFPLLRTSLAVGTLALALSACGSTNWGFPYRPDVQQGNWITSKEVAQLEAGMTREQVRFILGTPTLLDIFRTDRWDYPYYNKPGYGKEQERKFTVWFEGDSLVRWAGDDQPDRQPFQKSDTGMSKDGTVMKIESDAATSSDAQDQDQPEHPATIPLLDTHETRPADPGDHVPGLNNPEPLR